VEEAAGVYKAPTAYEWATYFFEPGPYGSFEPRPGFPTVPCVPAGAEVFEGISGMNDSD